jgi:hypothetical protein
MAAKKAKGTKDEIRISPGKGAKTLSSGVVVISTEVRNLPRSFVFTRDDRPWPVTFTPLREKFRASFAASQSVKIADQSILDFVN